MTFSRFPILLLPIAFFLGACRKDSAQSAAETFSVKRGDIDITVTESGSLEALESTEIKSKCSRTLKIVEIIEEGSVVSQEDVDKKKVLVKLDPNEFEDQLYTRESDLESARASFTESEEALLIQKSDNESSVRTAELNVTYAINDLRKLVGEAIANEVMDKKPENIAALLDDKEIGGQTKQDLRKFRSDIELAQIKLGRAKETLKYTQKLYEKQYVSKNELETDELDVRTQELALETNQSKLEIFRRYEFVKVFQKTWTGLLDAQEKLVRAKAVARSKILQAEARLKSRQSALRRYEDRLNDLKEDIQNCEIKAESPGFVVYKAPPRWRNTGPFREGSDVRPGQTIIELPDLSRMGITVKIQESQIDLIAPEQTATITIDAIPNQTFTGKVTRKAVLPSSQSWWSNPDLKLYETKIALDGENMNGTLRPGMTATIVILIDTLKEVLYVPIQAVRPDKNDDHFCFLPDGTRLPVKIGRSNQVFVEILEGLNEGQTILMAPPEEVEEKDREDEGGEPMDDSEENAVDAHE